MCDDILIGFPRAVHPARFDVRLGITKQSDDNFEDSEQAAGVRKISIHPDYDHIMDVNNIGLHFSIRQRLPERKKK